MSTHREGEAEALGLAHLLQDRLTLGVAAEYDVIVRFIFVSTHRRGEAEALGLADLLQYSHRTPQLPQERGSLEEGVPVQDAL